MLPVGNIQHQPPYPPLHFFGQIGHRPGRILPIGLVIIAQTYRFAETQADLRPEHEVILVMIAYRHNPHIIRETVVFGRLERDPGKAFLDRPKIVSFLMLAFREQSHRIAPVYQFGRLIEDGRILA